MLYYSLYHSLKALSLDRKTSPLPLTCLTALFIHGFAALSSLLPILTHLAASILGLYPVTSNNSSSEEEPSQHLRKLLLSDHSYYFTNLFSKFSKNHQHA